MLILIKPGVEFDKQTKSFIDVINSLEDLWDSEQAISADVVTDDEAWEEDPDEGITECTVILEIPSADLSLMLVQDEDDEDIWYIAVCNYDDEDPRVIDRKFEIDKTSKII